VSLEQISQIDLVLRVHLVEDLMNAGKEINPKSARAAGRMVVKPAQLQLKNARDDLQIVLDPVVEVPQHPIAA
jgi:hypothetical protein